MPEAAIWIRRVQVYKSLLRYHKGKLKNRGNLKRAARQCNILNPLSMSLQEIAVRLKECKRECLFYHKHGKRYRWRHLEKRKQAVLEEENEEAFNKICAIIRCKQQQDFWRKLNYFTGKKQMQSATMIQVEDKGGAIMERTTKDTVENTIFSKIHKKRYMMAGEAPICNGDLFDHFGYMANTPASRDVLDGKYVAPDNADAATMELFTEIATIRKQIPVNLVSIVISPERWKQYWKAMNKEMSLSKLGLHFGHYIAGCKLEIVSHYHTA